MIRINRIVVFISVFALAFAIPQSHSYAQDPENSMLEETLLDTLNAAVFTDSRRVGRALGELKATAHAIRVMASPMGEGDPIKWVQSLPGVATGADGSSAIFVRGGNMGNNLFSLDGVPVYGYSHILGLTTVIPQDIIESASLSKGGFEGSQGNFTSSHLKIVTKDPSTVRTHASAALNTFLASASVEGPILPGLSYSVSARVSPLTWEYKAARGALKNLVGGISDFTAGVGDLYGKIRWEISPRNSLVASFMGSEDNYSFTSWDGADDAMGWQNRVGRLAYHNERSMSNTDIALSWTRFGSYQEQEKTYRGVLNQLSLKSDLEEFSLSVDRHRYTRGKLQFDYGLKFRSATFAPGQISYVNISKKVGITSAYIQGSYSIPDKFQVRVNARGNSYFVKSKENKRFDPEIGVSSRWDISRHLALEATFDRTVQYYHTMEGLPVGWSLDMMVPSIDRVLPETAMQANFGILTTFKHSTVSLSLFDKHMENMIYYKYAQTLFSGALAEWEKNVDIGRGDSYGGELLYEFVAKDIYARVAYTLSKTTREGFMTINEGAEFHARFDRRHILNASFAWKGVSLALTAQSGHWENGAAVTYKMHIPGEEWTAEYYSGVNNYHMPTVFRLDVGYEFSFKTGRLSHDVNFGICNVTNHFNPFMLYFDASTESWKEIALVPFLPNFSWRIAL